MLAHFGEHLRTADGTIDRPGLAAIVFNSPAALAQLNAVTHPAIDAEIAAAIKAAPTGAIVVLDMAVLVESNLGEGQYDIVLVVEAPVEVRLDRLEGRGLPREQARARMASQATDEQRRAKGTCSSPTPTARPSWPWRSKPCGATCGRGLRLADVQASVTSATSRRWSVPAVGTTSRRVSRSPLLTRM